MSLAWLVRKFPYYSSAAVGGGRVVLGGRRIYVGSNDDRFYVLDLETGEKLWEFHAGAAITASPAIAQGRLVIGAADGAPGPAPAETQPFPGTPRRSAGAPPGARQWLRLYDTAQRADRRAVPSLASW